MKDIPLYNISNFPQSTTDGSFYANDFVSHLQNAFILQTHRHTFYLTVLFTKGSGVHEIDFHQYPIVSGSIFFMLPGQVHSWQLSANISGYVFFHNKEFFDLSLVNIKVNDFPFYKSLQNGSLIVLSADDLARIEPFYKEITMEFRNNELFKFQKIRSIVY